MICKSTYYANCQVGIFNNSGGVMNIAGILMISFILFLVMCIWYYVIVSVIRDYNELKRKFRENPKPKNRRLW